MLYWVIINNQRLGPLPVEELKNLNIQRDTLVWHEGLRDWSRAASLPELSDIVPAPAPIPPIPWRNGLQETPEPHGANRQAEPLPPTYLAWNIVVMICCCIPTGLVGLIYSTMVQPRYMRGDYDGARKASQNAEIWLIVTIVAGLISLPFQIIFTLL